MDTSLCKLPRNTLLDIDRAVWIKEDFSFYLLYKNGHIFMIQGPKSNKICPGTSILCGNPTIQDLHLRMILQRSESMPIERYKWLYLYQDKRTKRYHLVPILNSHTLQKVQSPLRLPTVQEKELQLIKWIGWGRSICLLNGQQLEVDIAWDTETFRRMKLILNILKIYSELDVCFKPVAHVLRGEDIIGIASEKRAGRELRYSDKRMFYETIARIISRRVYPRGPLRDMYRVHNGKLRITDNFHVATVWEGPKAEEEKKQEAFLWEMIEEMFERLKIEARPLEDTYALEDPPILMRYHQCRDAEHPQRGPSIVMHIYNPSLALFHGRALLYAPRRMTEVIRINRLATRSADYSSEDDAESPTKALKGIDLEEGVGCPGDGFDSFFMCC